MFTEKQQPLTMNAQQQEQIEKLQELGSQIRQVREEKSVSIDEVATKTRIQARLLIAIEEGKLDSLPEPVYIQGLIKQFAETLGLNGAEYAKAFPTDKKIYTIKPSWREVPAIKFAQLRPLHLYFFYFLLVVVSISGLSLSFLAAQRPSEDQPEQDSLEEQSVSASEASEPNLATANSPSNSKKEENSQQNPEFPVEVDVAIEADSWVRVISDGDTVYEGFLSAGENRNWTAQEELTIRAGNAGGVIVEYNQQSPEAMGSSGEVKEVTYSPSH